MPTLRVEAVSRSFGGLLAVDNVSFSVEEGEILGLIGPNGAGKTTLVNLISGFLKPDAGRIYLGEKTISGLKPHKVVAAGIARTFQSTELFLGFTVLEGMLVAAAYRAGLTWKNSLGWAPGSVKRQAESLARAYQILDFVGLLDHMDECCQNLPYGKQRALGVAMALACEPRVLLLDEPAAGMNREESLQLGELIKKVRSVGTTVLLVDHVMDLVMNVCDRIVVLNYGKKIAEGTPGEVCRDETVVGVYLGHGEIC